MIQRYNPRCLVHELEGLAEGDIDGLRKLDTGRYVSDATVHTGSYHIVGDVESIPVNYQMLMVVPASKPSSTEIEEDGGRIHRW